MTDRNFFQRHAESFLIVSLFALAILMALAFLFEHRVAVSAATPPAAGWTTALPSNTATNVNNELVSTSCISATNCYAVGYAINGSGVAQTLVENYNGTSWSVTSSQNTSTSQNNYLTGISCTSGGACWAVGYYYNGTHYQNLAEQLQSGSFVGAAVANNGSLDNHLTGVYCLTSSNCWASGYYTNGSGYSQTLIEQWTTAWALATSPNTSTTQNNYLQSISCASSTDCWVAGYYLNGTVNQNLVENYNGTSWSGVTVANTSSSQNNYLSGVSCSSAANCWIVGYYYTGTYYQDIIEVWNPSTNQWNGFQVNNSSATQSNYLAGVTCVSSSDCIAVGYYCQSSGCSGSTGLQTEIEQWDGTSWFLATSTNQGGTSNQNVLKGVACVPSASPDNCMTVGWYCEASSNCTGGTNASAQTMAEQYGGLVQNPPSAGTPWGAAAGTGDASASAPSAPSAIVGPVNTESGNLYRSASDISVKGRGFDLNLTRSFNSTPEPSGSSNDNYLYGTTCTSTSNCWAVGYYCTAIGSGQCSLGSYAQTLIEHYDGTAWTSVPSPNAGSGVSNVLKGVSCVSSMDCSAVGYYANTSGYQQTLGEHWDGTSWTIKTSANTSSTQNNYLAGVACISSTNCWAVGYYYNGSHYQTLVEQYNGTSWSGGTSGNQGTLDNQLVGVSCTSATDCSAVGAYLGTSNWQTLAEHSSGGTWSIVSSGNTSSTQLNTLQSISCVSTTFCLAAGYYNNGSIYQNLVEQFNGTSWSGITVANAGSSVDNELLGIKCTSTTDCSAVGGYHPSNWQTLTEHYSSGTWSVVTSGNTSSSQLNTLQGVACVTSTDCWGMGYYVPSAHQQLAEHYNGTSWSIPSGTNIPTGGAGNVWSSGIQGSFGFGWASNYAGVSLYQNGAGTQVTIVDATGSPVTFNLSGSTWVAPYYNASTLTTSGGNWTYTKWNGNVFTFNSSGQLTSQADRDGNTVALTYVSGKLSTVKDASNTRTLTFTFTGNVVTQISDPASQNVQYSYDASGDLIQVQNQAGAGHSTYFTYDGNHNLTSEKDPNGNATTYTYSTTTGQVLSASAPAGAGGSSARITQYAYTPSSNNQTTTTITDPLGNQTKMTFTYQLMTQRVDGYGSAVAATRSYLYDPNTLGVFQQTDPRNTATAFTYDISSNLLSRTVTPAAGLGSATTASATYNSLNEPLTQTDPNGNISNNTYDSHGNLTCTWVGASGTTCSSNTYGSTSFAYGDASNPGLPTTITDPNGYATTNTYTTAGDLASSTDAASNKTTFTWDTLGRKLTAVSPVGNVTGCGCATANTTTYTYNALNQVLTIQAPSPTGTGTATTTNTYDNDGNLLTTQDPRGNYASNGYDADSELCWTVVASSSYNTGTNPCGTTPTGGAARTYDAVGNVAQTTDPDGNVAGYAYDARNRKVSQTVDPGSGHLNLMTTYTYDANSNVLTVVRPRGNVSGCGCAATYTTTNTYDGYDQLLTSQDPNGHSTSYTYDSNGNKQTATDPLSIKTTNAYDPENHLCWTFVGTSSPSPVCASPPSRTSTSGPTTYAYDKAGNVTQATDPDGIYTTRVYSNRELLCRTALEATPSDCTTSPSGSTLYSYDPNANVTTVTDPNGNATSKAYNSANKLCQVYIGGTASCTGWVSGTTTYGYDADGNVLTAKDPNGNTATKAYDEQNRTCWSLIGTATSACTGTGLPPASSTQYAYDADGKPTQITNPDGTLVNKAYDAAGRVCWLVRGSVTGHTCSTSVTGTKYTYDADSNPYQVADPNGNITSTGYDATGLVCYVYTGASSNSCSTGQTGSTSYTRNNGGEVLTTTYPSSNVVSNAYDGNGRLCATYLTSGATCTTSGAEQYTYDAAGKLTTEKDFAGNATKLAYDSNGRLCSSYTGGGTLSCTVSGSTQYTYDNGGNVKTLTYPTGSLVVSQAYNAFNEPCWTYVSTAASSSWSCGSAPSGTLTTTSYTYDNNGNLKTEVMPNGVTNSYNYDAANSISSISDGSGGSVFAATYTRNASEMVSRDTSQPSANQYYQFTNQDRLCNAGASGNTCSSGSPTYQYAYDGAGNLTTNKGKTQFFNTGSGSNGTNELCWSGATSGASCTVPSGDTGYSYGSDFQRTATVPPSGPATCYSWNATLEMTQIQSGTGSTCTTPTTVASYTYNATGLRESKTVGSTTTTYSWDNSSVARLLQETAGSNTTSYVYGPTGTPLEEILPSGSKYFYSYDEQGSTRALTDSSGTTQNSDTYDPYGNITASTGSVQNNLLYKGEYLDSETGLYNMRARYYDPVTGQFTSLDPLAAVSQDPYGYASENPVNASDPTGLLFTTGCEDGGVCASSSPPPLVPCQMNNTCSTYGDGRSSGSGFSTSGGSWHSTSNSSSNNYVSPTTLQSLLAQQAAAAAAAQAALEREQTAANQLAAELSVGLNGAGTGALDTSNWGPMTWVAAPAYDLPTYCTTFFCGMSRSAINFMAGLGSIAPIPGARANAARFQHEWGGDSECLDACVWGGLSFTGLTLVPAGLTGVATKGPRVAADATGALSVDDAATQAIAHAGPGARWSVTSRGNPQLIGRPFINAAGETQTNIGRMDMWGYPDAHLNLEVQINGSTVPGMDPHTPLDWLTVPSQ